MVLASGDVHAEDLATLADILERERLAHCRTRSICFGLFVVCFALLIVAIGFSAYVLMAPGGSVSINKELALALLQILGVLSGAVFGFFGAWWTVQNCVHSIDRSLIAARAGRQRLFVGFVEQVQCTGKRTRELLVGMATSSVM